MASTLYTVGHSTHTINILMELLTQHSITAVYDVRSQPYSKYNPQFNRENLKACLEEKSIHYMFLGEKLGARSKNPEHYTNGKVQYNALAASKEFEQGLENIRQGLETNKVALLCAEKDPLICHRAILICRHLRHNGIAMQHILEDGSLESTTEFESRLLQALKLPEQDLFTTREETIERAYEIQSEKIAYVDDSFESQPPKKEKQVIGIYTIGFTKKSAEEFFTKLSASGIQRVVDVRLNNVSQLAGFTKKEDLKYFLCAINKQEYVHLPTLAPTKELLDAYKKRKGSWETYEKEFIELMDSRKVETIVSKELLDGACLLCSEDEPQHCHRRLVAEYLRDKWQDVTVKITHIT